MGNHSGSRRRCRHPILDVLETRGLLSGLGGWQPPTPLIAEPPARVPGHVAVQAPAKKATVAAHDPSDSPPHDDTSRYSDSDDRKVLASVESPAPATHQGLSASVYDDDSAATGATGYQSRSMWGTSGAVAPSSSLNTTDLRSSTAGSGIAPSFSIPWDGESTRSQIGRLATSTSTGPSAAGIAASGAEWKPGQSSSGRAAAGEPDAIRIDPATILEHRATEEVPLPAPRGDGLISHLTQFSHVAIETAFNRWFVQFENHGAIVGSYEPKPTQLLFLSLTASAVIAGISLSRHVRRGDERLANEGRGEGHRGSILEFPVAWSPRIP
jgi:hypothetical protein